MFNRKMMIIAMALGMVAVAAAPVSAIDGKTNAKRTTTLAELAKKVESADKTEAAKARGEKEAKASKAAASTDAQKAVRNAVVYEGGPAGKAAAARAGRITSMSTLSRGSAKPAMHGSDGRPASKPVMASTAVSEAAKSAERKAAKPSAPAIGEKTAAKVLPHARPTRASSATAGNVAKSATTAAKPAAKPVATPAAKVEAKAGKAEAAKAGTTAGNKIEKTAKQAATTAKPAARPATAAAPTLTKSRTRSSLSRRVPQKSPAATAKATTEKSAKPAAIAAPGQKKAPTAAKRIAAPVATPDSRSAKPTLAGPKPTMAAPKAAAPAAKPTAKPSAISRTAQPAAAKPIAAKQTTKPVSVAAAPTARPAAKPVMSVPAAPSSDSNNTPVAYTVAGGHGATKTGPTRVSTNQNPSAGGSLIARNGKNGAPNIMRVLTGKSIMIDMAKDAKRVAVADPDIAEVLVITPRQVMVNGLSDGETSIIIWDRAGNYTMSTVVVGDDLADQVMLEVTVAELNRSAMERHGVDYRNFGGQFNSITQYGGVSPTGGSFPPQSAQPPFPISLDGGLSWAIIDAKNDIALLFRQLQDDALGRILAEPKLLARSGKEASFLSGGEIPIVVSTNDDTSIEFKEFGVSIDFTPAVREDGSIDLLLESEVSEADFAAGIELFGFTVPAFVTRRSNTEVTLRDNQSLIVAGLIKETKQEIETKMPFVGDIPVLGYFFKRTEFANDILELVMVVKPRLVKPIPSGTRVNLPTDRGPLTRQEVRTGPVEEKVARPRPY